jgi:hypothetical protein
MSLSFCRSRSSFFCCCCHNRGGNARRGGTGSWQAICTAALLPSVIGLANTVSTGRWGRKAANGRSLLLGNIDQHGVVRRARCCRMRVVVACMNPGTAFRLSDAVKFLFMEALRRQVSFREQWETAGHWPERELVRSVRNGGFPLQSDVLRRRHIGASSKGVLTLICLCGVCTSAVLEGALFFWESDGRDESETGLGEQQTAQLPVTSPSKQGV